VSRRGLASLGASLAAHGAGLALVFLLVQGESLPALLFVDLTREPGPGGAAASAPSGGAPASAQPGAVGPRAPAGRRGPGPPTTPPAPRATPRAAPPAPAAPALVAPAEPSPAAASAAATAPAAASAAAPIAAIAAAPGASLAVAPPRPAGEGAPARAGNVGAGGRGGAAFDAPPGVGLGLGPSAMAGSGSGLGAGRAGAGGSGRGTLAAALPAPASPATEYGGYLAEVRRRIQEALRYPLAARRRGLAGTVQLEILIRADGEIGGVALAGSSSHRLLDDAALEAVRGLGPVPFPAGVAPRPLRVRLPVVFELE